MVGLASLGIKDVDAGSVVVGNVEVSGFIKRHAIRTRRFLKNGEDGPGSNRAITSDLIAEDPVRTRLGQVDRRSIGCDGDTIGEGHAGIQLLKSSVRKGAVEPPMGFSSEERHGSEKYRVPSFANTRSFAPLSLCPWYVWTHADRVPPACT